VQLEAERREAQLQLAAKKKEEELHAVMREQKATMDAKWAEQQGASEQKLQAERRSFYEAQVGTNRHANCTAPPCDDEGKANAASRHQWRVIQRCTDGGAGCSLAVHAPQKCFDVVKQLVRPSTGAS
jgi:hypothetical protein